jgi:hypothetical protein
VGKQARNSRREAERAAEREAALRSRRRSKLLPYWIAAGIVVVVVTVSVPVLLTSSASGPRVEVTDGLGGFNQWAQEAPRASLMVS